MRDPAIHMTRSSLITVLELIGYKHPKALADNIFRLGEGYQIRDRFITNITSKKVNENMERLKKLNKAPMSVDQFQLLLIDVRQKHNHKMISRITATDKDYLLLKDVCLIACDFAKAAETQDLASGCRMFLNLGIEMMRNKYALNKFKTFRDKIYNLYEFYSTLANDPTPELTEEVQQVYVQAIKDLTQADFSQDYNKLEERINFFYAKNDIQKNNADIDEWVTAQFAVMFNDYDTLPSPNQLYGDNASKRYRTFKMFKKLPSEERSKPQQGSIMAEYNKKVKK